MKEYFDNLLTKTETVLKIQLELLRLKTINKLSYVFSSLISGVIFSVIAIFLMLNVNIGLAIWIGTIMENPYLGFFIVAAFYLVVLVCVLFVWKKHLVGLIRNLVIKELID